MEEPSLRFTSPARRSTRAVVSKTEKEPVAQRRGTKLAPATRDAEEATAMIEEKHGVQEPPVSDTNVSQSRKRRRVDDEPLAFADPRSLGIAVAQKSPNSKTGCTRREIQRAESEPIQVRDKLLCLGYITK